MTDESLRSAAIERPIQLRSRDVALRQRFESEEKRMWPAADFPPDASTTLGWTLLDLLPKFNATFPTLCKTLLDRGVAPLHSETAGALVRLFPKGEEVALRHAIRERFEGDSLDDEFMQSLNTEDVEKIVKQDIYDNEGNGYSYDDDDDDYDDYNDDDDGGDDYDDGDYDDDGYGDDG
jgi:hypothetical protein